MKELSSNKRLLPKSLPRKRESLPNNLNSHFRRKEDHQQRKNQNFQNSNEKVSLGKFAMVDRYNLKTKNANIMTSGTGSEALQSQRMISNNQISNGLLSDREERKVV